jgi:hypothetical protein
MGFLMKIPPRREVVMGGLNNVLKRLEADPRLDGTAKCLIWLDELAAIACPFSIFGTFLVCSCDRFLAVVATFKMIEEGLADGPTIDKHSEFTCYFTTKLFAHNTLLRGDDRVDLLLR